MKNQINNPAQKKVSIDLISWLLPAIIIYTCSIMLLQNYTNVDQVWLMLLLIAFLFLSIRLLSYHTKQQRIKFEGNLQYNIPPTKTSVKELTQPANLLTNYGAKTGLTKRITAPQFIEKTNISQASKEVRTSPTDITQEDLKWMAELEEKVLASLSDFNFTLDALGQMIFLSSRQIRRKLKHITGLTFSQYLREMRFKEAQRLLESREVRSVKGLAYKIGMRDAKYFSQQFKQHFGKLPSDYLS